MNKKLSAEKRAARMAQQLEAMERLEKPRLMEKLCPQKMREMADTMKELAVRKNMKPISDEEAMAHAEHFMEYIEYGLDAMKRAADAGKLNEEETKAIRLLQPLLY